MSPGGYLYQAPSGKSRRSLFFASMRIPSSLETLAHHGVIEEVLRPLMSGKEAQIYLVVADGRECAAKIYKDAQNRSFKNRADYTEGRKVRNSRDQRAIDRGTKYGKGKKEDTWKSTEVDMIYRLRDAGVRVPAPYMFIDGVLLMELVTDEDGNPAPRLGDLEFTPEEAREIHERLLREVVLMLCAGMVHADLSEFNVLLGADGPVVIDFPQSVNAAGNQSARRLLIRDIGNLYRFLARWAPDVRQRPYGEELWALYETGELTPETKLTGRFKNTGGPVDTSAVLELISDANRDEARHRRAVGRSAEGGGESPVRPPLRRREVIVNKPEAKRSRGADARPAGALHREPKGSAKAKGPGDARGPSGSHGSRKRGPQRGNAVQASTYVSPEARKMKDSALSLTPRSETSPTPRQDSRPTGHHKERSTGVRPGNRRRRRRNNR